VLKIEFLLFVCEQVVYMALVGSFPFNSFLSGVLSCVGTAVLAGKCSRSITICRLACYEYTHTNTFWYTMSSLSLLDTCARHGTYKPATNICIKSCSLSIWSLSSFLHCGPVCLRIQVNKENKEFKVKILV